MQQEKPKRIVFVLPKFTAGGAERVMINLMNNLDRARFTPYMVVVDGNGPLRNLVAEDISVHILGHKRVMRSLPDLARTLRSLKPDVIFSTMAHMNFAVLMVKHLIGSTKIIVREAVTPSFFADSSALRWPMIKASYKWLYPLADLILSPSALVRDELITLIGERRIKTALLYNPVMINDIRQKASAALSAATPGLSLVAAGRLHPQKGFDALIEAFATAPPQQDWHLKIIGEGDQRPQLESLITQHQLDAHITLEGHHTNPWAFVAQADALLMPSRHEGLPNVALEALALGTPVYATRTSGGIQEIADAAQPGAVTIFETTDDLAKAVNNINAQTRTELRPSLLPDLFLPENVTQRFTDILDGLVTA